MTEKTRIANQIAALTSTDAKSLKAMNDAIRGSALVEEDLELAYEALGKKVQALGGPRETNEEVVPSAKDVEGVEARRTHFGKGNLIPDVPTEPEPPEPNPVPRPSHPASHTSSKSRR